MVAERLPMPGNLGGRGIALLALAAVVLWAFSGFFRVEPDELGELASKLTSALQSLQEYLKAEGERVQREIVDYGHLNRTALAAIKT